MTPELEKIIKQLRTEEAGDVVWRLALWAVFFWWLFKN